jgi:hypothetical protein
VGKQPKLTSIRGAADRQALLYSKPVQIAYSCAFCLGSMGYRWSTKVPDVPVHNAYDKHKNSSKIAKSCGSVTKPKPGCILRV